MLKAFKLPDNVLLNSNLKSEDFLRIRKRSKNHYIVNKNKSKKEKTFNKTMKTINYQ